MARAIGTCLVFWFLTAYLAISASTRETPLKHNIIDLGYARHIPSFTNTTEQGRKIKVYKNIRFAQPPTGAFRFQKPQQPPPFSKDIHNGLYEEDTRCVSAVLNGADILFPGLGGKVFGNEDCLFLDVYVPDGIGFDAHIPVLHHMYGSGYAFGSKEFAFSPLGLFDQVLGDDKPFILVASNYRMGLYGWASSPYEAMNPNNGLWDALAALQWTREHIKKFGGDPNRVAAIGQSAGAAIIEMLGTSAKLSDTLPFQHAFLSSSALSLKKNVTERRQQVYESILSATNCTNLECLKGVGEKDLAEINRHLVNDVPSLSGGGNSGPGIGFGPVVDHDLVPDLTVSNLDLDEDSRGLKRIVVGNMANEGAIVSSDKGMPEAFPSLARRILPSASNATIEAIQSMYHYPKDHPEQLAWYWTADAVFVCHSLALAKTIPQRARRYIMSVPPAYHGQDLNYYYFVSNETTPVADIEVARKFQAALGDFLYGDDTRLSKYWPVFGSSETVLDIGDSGFRSRTANKAQMQRCDFINKEFADPRNGI